jgi:hypothetical protein
LIWIYLVAEKRAAATPNSQAGKVAANGLRWELTPASHHPAKGATNVKAEVRGIAGTGAARRAARGVEQ